MIIFHRLALLDLCQDLPGVDLPHGDAGRDLRSGCLKGHPYQ